MNSLSIRPQNKNFGSRIAIITSKRMTAIHQESRNIYALDQTKCKRCLIDYRHRKNSFCSKACAASFNNLGRIHSKEQKRKTAESVKRHHALTKPAKLTKPPRIKKEKFPYSKVKPCRGCGKYLKDYKKLYCDHCHPNINLYRSRCNFKFNIYHYPDNFPLSLIKEHGWYSPGGRKGKNRNRNMTGVSRDHMFSIVDGYRLNVDPAIMSHPANCQLLLHQENNSKNFKSSITLDELLQRILIWTSIH